MKRFLTVILLLAVLRPAAYGGDDFYENQLNRGLRNSDTYSYLLMQQADKKGENAVHLLNQALAYSPDLPAVYFAMAQANFSFSYSGIFNSIDYIVQGLNAYARNFWWSFTLTASLFFSFVFSFILSCSVIVFLRLGSDLPLLSHEISEKRAYAAFLLALMVLSLFSPLWFIAGMLILLGIYMRTVDKVVVYLFLVFLVAAPVLFQATSFFLNTFSSGHVKAIVQSNEGRDNRYALAVLTNQSDQASLFSLALALKREGQYNDAIAILDKLSAQGKNPKVYVNLGNCYIGLYNFEETNKHYLSEALQYYEKAIAIKPSAAAYYNLSAISRELLDFNKGEEYFQAALAIDRVAVAGFRSISGRQTNRIVVDETLSPTDLWDFLRTAKQAPTTFGMSLLPAPAVSAGSIMLIVLFYFLDQRLMHRAYRCRKCTTILCSKCEKNIMWGQMCPQCYKSLIKLDELDVRERVARILSIYEQQQKRRNTMNILSFILPGSSQIYAGNILSGFLLLWPFMFFVTIPLVIVLLIQNNALQTHSFVKWSALSIAIVLYGITNIITRKRIAKGWR